MKRKWLMVAIVACVFGMIAAGVSFHNYLRIHSGTDLDKESFCALSEHINCDVVEASSFAAINDIPIAGLGFAYYFLILIFSAYSRFSRGIRRPTVAFSWWSTVPAVIYSLGLMYVSIFVLNTLCLTCITMYIVNITLFISLYLAMGIPRSEYSKFLFGYWVTLFSKRKKCIDFAPKFGTHFLISVIVFGISLVFITTATAKIDRLSQTQIDDYVDRHYRQSKYEINIDKDVTPMWGRKGAAVTIVEYSDYRCPFCKVAAFTIKPFLAEYKDDVAYYFVNYPLDSTCNHYMQHQMHPGACLGAKGGLCAEKVGKFWRFHDELFRSTGNINLLLLKDIAKKLNMNEDEFVECLNSSEVERTLKSEIDSARKIYITGTPSIFINDRNLKYWKNTDILKEIVEKEIKDSKK